MIFPQDGQSIKEMMTENAGKRQKPIPFSI
jgi:hypothetical protein